MKKENNITTFFKALPKNIFSGFVVSLIALPLGLGLAMASEAPPIAGIITAVIGGVLASLLGGSHVTITGPGNGLVGGLLIAMTVLGPFGAYAAIITSGVVLLTLGFLRLGKLADFFPSSAIQGMLAAIGLIILGKQFHIMLGNQIKRDSNVSYLLEIPATIKGAFLYDNSGFTYAAMAGVLSLCIMVFYPKIRNKYLQLIPAPMWIVLLSIGFSYYYELVLKLPHPIDPAYMISNIPTLGKIVSDVPTPDFSAIGSLPFWSSVFGLTLIASIESLLSIKAVDKLDPQKRRSNINRDLKALGIATIGSGFLGGLNVVTVIARSSVNVNNGATNRSANFFHASFLVLFIALFSTQLKCIPLPALMAILVFTGYKLASPLMVGKIFSIGKEQLIIFFGTLVTTLFSDLITGITTGIVLTFIIHVIVTKNATLFFRNVLKPNVLMFKEPEGISENSYYVSVKHFCTFLNFYKLKEKLDAISEDTDVVVDFSKCEFVDHTVMENLHNYRELFTKRGGHFEVIGLDMHDTKSEHPFALRRLLPIPKVIKKSLTKRQVALEELAKDYHLDYDAHKNEKVRFLDTFFTFRSKKINHITNRLSNTENRINTFDLTFSEGEFIAKEVIRTTMLIIKLPSDIPAFTLDKEGLLEKIYSLTGNNIDIEGHSDFSSRFYLLGKNEKAILNFFSDEIIHFFESNAYYHIESNGKELLIFDKERLASIKEIKALLDYGKRLEQVICTEITCNQNKEKTLMPIN